MKIHSLPKRVRAYILVHDLRDQGVWYYGSYATLKELSAAANELYAMGDSGLGWCYASEAVAA